MNTQRGPESNAVLSRHSSRRSRELPEGVSRRLGVYAAAAGAACAGILGAPRSAAAQVVYTPAHVVIGPGTTYDLDTRATADFKFSNKAGRLFVEPLDVASCCTTAFLFDGVEVNASNSVLPLALSGGAKIGSSKLFTPASFGTFVDLLMAGTGGNGESGNFLNVKDRYLGLRFTRGVFGEVSYGWARFTVAVKPNHQVEAVLTGYAYEAAEGVPIHAGQTSGTADKPVYAPNPGGDGATRDELQPGPGPISQGARPAWLGLLALGAQGIPFWRRESPTPGSAPGQAPLPATEPGHIQGL